MILQCQNISKSFDGHKILNNISMAAAGGEVVAIWGPNMCGKTTLLKILARLFSHDGPPGELTHAVGTSVGYVPQAPSEGLLPWFSAQHNLTMASRLEKGDKRLMTLLKDYNMDEQDMQKKPPALSGGCRQRLAIVCALANGSNCLFLDEPLSAQDHKSYWNILSRLRTVRDQGKTIVITTHDPNATILCADRILTLKPDREKGSSIVKELLVSLPRRDSNALSSTQARQILTELF